MSLDVSKFKTKHAPHTTTEPRVRPPLSNFDSARLQELRRAAAQSLRAYGEALLDTADALDDDTSYDEKGIPPWQS